ncbi:MAG: hypothetical protein AUJ57_08225 [Zetaproteobacteria bacterium CG1_02_53_45]|nr:MAG: hypothetical protein AUJ57_08225 [Zetaproteobacteria bacterium CG1_02_53_45]
MMKVQTVNTTPCKAGFDLTPGMPAHLAAGRILQSLFHTMQANEAGMAQNIDTECLHDFRISVRRTRTALARFKSVLPRQFVQQFRSEFTWLGNVTTPPRDLDVFLLDFDTYQQALPASMQKDLKPFRLLLQRKLGASQQMLIKHLHSARYLRLKQQWSDALEQSLSEAFEPAAKEMPAIALARQCIGKQFRRILRKGAAIHRHSPAQDLHKLRKSCKKLHYLTGFFRHLYPPREIKALLKQVKRLQNNLGMFQDLTVQSSTLQAISREMKNAGALSQDSDHAMDVLIDQLHGRRKNRARLLPAVSKSLHTKKTAIASNGCWQGRRHEHIGSTVSHRNNPLLRPICGWNSEVTEHGY